MVVDVNPELESEVRLELEQIVGECYFGKLVGILRRITTRPEYWWIRTTLHFARLSFSEKHEVNRIIGEFLGKGIVRHRDSPYLFFANCFDEDKRGCALIIGP